MIRERRCPVGVTSRRVKGKESTHSSPLSTYSAPGGLRQDPGRAVESPAVTRTWGNGSSDMRVLLSAYGSRGDVEPRPGRRFPPGKSPVTKDCEGSGE